MQLVAGSIVLRRFQTEAVLSYFFHVFLDCNLFEINISYDFQNIKAINLLCQQPSAQLIVTLNSTIKTSPTV